MDSKRAATDSGDGVDAKRMNTTEDPEKFNEDGNTQSLDKEVAPCTGNGCTPSPESFMFQATSTDSQLLPWCQTSENDLDLEKSASGSKKTETSIVKTSRREQAKARREDTMKALALERELTIKPGQGSAAVVLLIRFPDPEITVPMLTDLSKDIRDVVMPSSVSPRYCLVHLKTGADVEATIADINKVPFGAGFLQAEHKHFSDEEQAEFIDPCSLYVSNIPFNMTTSAIKAYFANALRVDIGVLKREKRARYAFVRYASPEATTVAFRELVSCPLNSRTLTVRYRRLRKRTGLPLVQCANSILTMTLQNGGGAGGDDDNADCKVISPPPVESITISDSDNCSDSSGDGKDRRVHKSKSNEQEEIQKLKRQMAEYGAIIKNLQIRQNYLGDTYPTGLVPKTEPCANPSAYIPVLGSNAVHLMRDIKTERAYLGIPDEAVSEPEPAQKPASQTPLDNITGKDKKDQQKAKSFARRRQSAKEKADKKTKEIASPDKDERLAELYAQLETDTDP